MIPATYRLNLALLTTRGRRHSFSTGTIVFFDSSDVRWAVTITKKAVPLATSRNHLRRQLHHYLYQHRHQLPPHQSFKIILRRPPPPTPLLLQELCSLLSIAPSN